MDRDKTIAELKKLVQEKEALVFEQIELIKRLKAGNTKDISSIIENNPEFKLVASLLKREGII